jgi:hypothetical protein
MPKIVFAVALFSAAAVFADVRVTSVSPQTGPSAGGFVVTINGSGFCTEGACPFGMQVFFGGTAAADVKVISDTKIEAIMPPGAAGGSGILLVNGPTGTGVLENAFRYVSSSASDYERILIPIAGGGPGAFNSLWVSEIFILNSGATSFVTYGFRRTCALCPEHPPFEAMTFFIPRNETSFLPGDRADSPLTPGLMLYVSPKKLDPSVSLSLLLRNLNVQRDKWGTEIPVVREDRFRSGLSELMNIPLDPRFRVMLRVYDIDNIQDGADTFVTVRRFARHNSVEHLVDERSLRLLEVPGGSEFVPFPGYGSTSDVTADLFSDIDTLRIEIQPVTLGLRYWAFVSITNNVTQDVTIVSPQ